MIFGIRDIALNFDMLSPGKWAGSFGAGLVAGFATFGGCSDGFRPRLGALGWLGLDFLEPASRQLRPMSDSG